MVTKVSPSLPTAGQRGRQLPPVEATALVVLRPMTRDELAGVPHVLKASGVPEFKPARVMLSQRDARTVASGCVTPVDVTLAAAPHPDPETGLEQALTETRARGAALKEELLADPAMPSTAAPCPTPAV